jgi:hypothetical protein
MLRLPLSSQGSPAEHGHYAPTRTCRTKKAMTRLKTMALAVGSVVINAKPVRIPALTCLLMETHTGTPPSLHHNSLTESEQRTAHLPHTNNGLGFSLHSSLFVGCDMQPVNHKKYHSTNTAHNSL